MPDQHPIDWGLITSLVIGHKYRVVTLIPPQRIEREHVVTYLGRLSLDNEVLYFDARPYAGTQQIVPEHIMSCVRVQKDTNHYMNRLRREE